MDIISVRVGSAVITPVVTVEPPSTVNASLKNINISGGGSAKNAVLYDPQTLTDAQKEQARTNIGAVGADEIPNSTSDLTNDSGFITRTVSDLANYYLKSETYSKEELDNKLSAIPKFSIEVVSSLPTSDISNTTVYLVASGDEEDNLYTEYIYVNSAWEYLGKQTVDLTGYVERTELSSYYTKSEMEELLNTVENSIPTKLSQLTADSTHRTVTDAEKETWNTKQPAGNYALKSELPTKTSQLTDDVGFAKQTDVDSLSEEIVDLSSEVSYISPFIVPQQFGAVADGSTDDTQAINDALAEAGTTGLQVYFPAGTYKITAPLAIPSGIMIKGDAGNSVIKSYLTSGYVLQGSSNTTLSSVSIVDLTFENGNVQDSTTKMISGDFMYNATGLYMRNCRVKKYYRVFNNISNNSYVYNNRFTSIYKHFINTSTDSVIDGNYINASRYGFPYNSKVYAGQLNSTSFRNNLVDYFFDVFSVTYTASGTITSNTFNRCVNIFHDNVAHLTITDNLFTGIRSSAVDLSVLTDAQITALEAEKWCVIKFDDTSYDVTNHIMAEVVFANNIGYNVEYYIYVAEETQVVVAECEFRGNMINTGSGNVPSAVDVGFRNATATETTYNSFQNVYFDFLDMKKWTALPNPSLLGNTAKSVVCFPYMKAIYNNEIYININGTWRMYAPPIYDGGIA